MKTQTIRDLLSTQPVLAGLDEGDLDLMAGCARNEVFEPGAFMAREGEPADRFFVVRAGRVGLGDPRPDRSARDRDAGGG